ncbi:histidine utilization repressor [Desulfopila sp. IMCC35008]|uniref:histidine utilization repressor n=1 Tax=Desulfopila sp. IMCC35008 TaxID=2653858 RepID=UPI0013D335B8|nr:histidine utilization repressor [Desulfopila sp. IMCC35008]
MTKQSERTPLYERVKQYIMERVDSKIWQPGMKIDSEAELVAATGASRMTVNRALRELTAEGRLTRKQGLGTFVAEKKSRAALLEIKSIAKEIRDNGGDYSCSIHLLQEEKVRPELASLLGLSPYEPVFHSVIVHKDGGTPIQLGSRFINPTIAPDYLNQDFTRTTPSDYLLQLAPVSAVEHEVEALIPEAWIRDLLQTNHHEPCLALYRKTWVGEVIATYSTFYYPGSRYTLGSRFTPSGATTINIS